MTAYANIQSAFRHVPRRPHLGDRLAGDDLDSEREHDPFAPDLRSVDKDDPPGRLSESRPPDYADHLERLFQGSKKGNGEAAQWVVAHLPELLPLFAAGDDMERSSRQLGVCTGTIFGIVRQHATKRQLAARKKITDARQRSTGRPGREVVCLDRPDLPPFPRIKDAAEWAGLSRSAIALALNTGRTAGGYRWRGTER